jgi:Dyp-type peroxidase family
MEKVEKVEWDDVQAIVLRGFGKLPFSSYVLWQFNTDDNLARKQWLAALTERLTRAIACDDEDGPDVRPAAQERASGRNCSEPAINLALTASGLRKFVGESALNGFSTEFIEGMAPTPSDPAKVPRRSNVLGDIGKSSPQCWDWGGWEKECEIDGLLLLFAVDEPSLRDLVKFETQKMAGVARPIPIDLRGRFHFDDGFTEHFGFKDGISQPLIEGVPCRKKPEDSDDMQARISLVKPGEFLLGYLNERKERVGKRRGTNGNGPAAKRDLRLNGTYLVFRQLEQDVAAFDAFVSNLAACLCETKDWVRARLMGREPDGKPLIHTDALGSGALNDFLYHYEDQDGLVCPIGAHVRRANPRDSLGPDPDTALHLSKMHRIIRRGRPYGNRWEPGRTQEMDESRGMLFIALNADIAGQFEMIQHTWLNNPHFNGLYTGTDPISHFDDGGLITIQQRPMNLHIKREAPFVRVRGGAYFFLPGIQALRDIAASLPDEPRRAASAHLSHVMT